jgi:choline dehydrogenase-like flavoprotein
MAAKSDLCVVVGSGPAGVSCAKALLAQGKTVHMLDAGITLEPRQADLVARMRATAPAEWVNGDLNRIKEGTSAGTKGIPLKLAYASDFPYQEADKHAPADYQGVGFRPSFAQGGLSNVWGAAMMPYRQADIEDWPIRISELASHYEAVLEFMSLSARHDDLEALFPLYTQRAIALQPGTQSKLLLARLQKRQSRLAGAGVHFGHARVAVKAVPEGNTGKGAGLGCVYCGLCMYGCPYGFIYNSADSVRELMQQPGFVYEPAVIVTRVSEAGEEVLLEGYNRATGAAFQMKCARAYLATGVIPTAQILLRSKNLYDQTVWMRDSQYFLLPLAMLAGAGDVRKEQLHTLSQLFIEMTDSSVSPYTVHLQVYSYNDLIGQAIANAMGLLAAPLSFLGRALERRLFVVQGYLHSQHSARIGLTLKKTAPGGPERLELKSELQPQTEKIIRQVGRKLFGLGRQIGAFPLLPMLQIAEPGRGFHSGGAFPMRRQPGPLETDILGRPFGWQRVHVVDASVLPSIPATTITFTVMANAHRIGTASAKL